VSVAVGAAAAAAMQANKGDCSRLYHEGVETAERLREARAGRQGVLEQRVRLLRRLAAAAAVTNSNSSCATARAGSAPAGTGGALLEELLQDLPGPLASILAADKWKSLASGGSEGGVGGDEGRQQAGVTWERVQQDCMQRGLHAVRSNEQAVMTAERGAADAAVELAGMARAPPVAVMTTVLDAMRLDAMPFAKV
jgi:hypothetical protein